MTNPIASLKLGGAAAVLTALMATASLAQTAVPTEGMTTMEEVQFPTLDGFATDQEVIDSLSAQGYENVVVLRGPETLIVISSDLSHYLSYREAQWSDRAAVAQVLDLQAGLDHEQACGATPINGLLIAARKHHLHAHLLDLRNSGDTAGDRAQVVGYTSIAFCEAETPSHARH